MLVAPWCTMNRPHKSGRPGAPESGCGGKGEPWLLDTCALGGRRAVERSSPATSFVRLFRPPVYGQKELCPFQDALSGYMARSSFRVCSVELFFQHVHSVIIKGFFSVCFLELDIGLYKGEMACHLQFSLQVFRKGKMEWNLDILESG